MTNLHGLDIKLTPERKSLLASGWEYDRIKSMIENLKRGDVVFDIGAEQGDISVLLAKKTGKIVLFEPSPVMWPHIRTNFIRSKINPLGCFVGFASDINDEKPRSLDYIDKKVGVWPECAFSKKKDEWSFRHLDEEADATKQITLDTWCQRHGIWPDMVTIDVEGAEWNVLQGMEKVIDKAQPLIYISVHDEILWKRYKKWFRDIWNEYLKPAGYKVDFLGADHELHFVFYKKDLVKLNRIT